jgi:PelA/Pel-15E family pectate lyase
MNTAILLVAAFAKIVLVGDSTVNDEGGWGPGFRAALSPEIEIVNLARNGRSSKSFRDEGLWTTALALKPKYILIQFGHNDEPGKGPERETDPATTYRANMARYVEEARAIGVTPILVTSIVRRNFDAAGRIRRDGLVPYVEEVRRLAAEKSVPLIDLYDLTRQQSEKLGRGGSEWLGAKLPGGEIDATHLGPRGQQSIGLMAAREVVRLIPGLRPYFQEPAPSDAIQWRDAFSQPAGFYGSKEAVRIADNLLLYQHDDGGWDKNIDMAAPVTGKQPGRSTIDNDSTYTQLRYLAKIHYTTKQERFAAAFQRGLNYLFAAQYPNGGWPQFYPLRDGYWDHITYNDDAMIGVMELLRDVVDGDPEFAFVGAADRARAKRAIDKGVECILKTQVIQNGKLTAWCAQHDEHTLAPIQARAYELASLSGSESVGVVEYLMAIDHPSAEVIRAVQGAVAWFSAVKIAGIRIETKPASGTARGTDRVTVADPAAPPQWARFYELGTNRPIFVGRDGVVKYQMSEIEYERRNGYRWYIDRPGKTLEEEYPAWIKKWSQPDVRVTDSGTL